MSLCAIFVLQTKTTQIVGVAGTDVPVEDIKKHLLLHEVSVVQYFVIIKPTRRTNFTNLFWRETLHVSDSSSARHQQFIHCTLSNGICHTGL